MANVAAIQKLFLSSPYYAVIGASKDQDKFGTRILNWYRARSMQVQPIHPKESHLEGIPTIPTVGELPSPTKTSISIITPPKAALPLGVPAVWIQPGAADEAVAAWVKENGMEGRVIYGGPCILMEGDSVRSLL